MLGLAACAAPPAPSAPAPLPFVGPLSLQPAFAPRPGPPVLQRPGTQADFAVHVDARVLFAYDSAALDDFALVVLDRQAEWLRSYPEYRVLIEGHADERGSEQYNYLLGLERAEAVRNRLVASGVDPVRVLTTSHGATRPAVAGAGETVWAQNRRAITLLLN